MTLQQPSAKCFQVLPSGAVSLGSATWFQAGTVDTGEFIVPFGPDPCSCQGGGVRVGKRGEWRRSQGRTPSRFLLRRLCGALLSAHVSFKDAWTEPRSGAAGLWGGEAAGKSKHAAWHIRLRENKDEGCRAVCRDQPPMPASEMASGRLCWGSQSTGTIIRGAPICVLLKAITNICYISLWIWYKNKQTKKPWKGPPTSTWYHPMAVLGVLPASYPTWWGSRLNELDVNFFPSSPFPLLSFPALIWQKKRLRARPSGLKG